MFKYITTLSFWTSPKPTPDLGVFGILKREIYDVFYRLGTVPDAIFEERVAATSQFPDGIYSYTRETGWTLMEGCTTMPERPGIFAEVTGAYTIKLKDGWQSRFHDLQAMDMMLDDGGCTVITEILCAYGRIRRQGNGVTVWYSEPRDIILGAHGRTYKRSWGIFTWGVPYVASEF
jgi:hypothetical protein